MRFYIKDLVYGANDGIVTTFAVVASVIGAELEPRVILIIGFASLIADGFSMAASDYLGSKSQEAVTREAERGGQAPPALQTNALKSAALTFLSFVIIGSTPILPYLFMPGSEDLFLYTSVTTAIVLFAVGSLRTLVTKRNFIRAGLEMTLVGGAAVVIAYFIGHGVSRLT